MRLAVVMGALLAVQAPAPTPQNPSPMSDTTRPHPRVAAYEPPGLRATLGEGRLFVRRGANADRLPLVVHFHGASWLLEHHVARFKRSALLLTFQLGSGSGVYARAFADPTRFAALVKEATAEASRLLGRRVSVGPVVLSSFSAGYGAVRAILRQPAAYDRVAAVILADSLHAGYAVADAGAPRAKDLPVDAADLDAFVRLAGDAVAGRKQFDIVHSEVFPGTYASTTETADALLAAVGLKRRARLREGPIGMQQLSETGRGRLLVRGFAGNSAPDHLDHLYAFGEWLARVEGF